MATKCSHDLSRSTFIFLFLLFNRAVNVCSFACLFLGLFFFLKGRLEKRVKRAEIASYNLRVIFWLPCWRFDPPETIFFFFFFSFWTLSLPCRQGAREVLFHGTNTPATALENYENISKLKDVLFSSIHCVCCRALRAVVALVKIGNKGNLAGASYLIYFFPRPLSYIWYKHTDCAAR